MAGRWARAGRAAAVVALSCGMAAAVVWVPGPTAVAAAGRTAAPAAPAATGLAPGAVFVPVTPVRVLDTRHGTGGYSSPVGPGKTISLQVTGKDNVPSSGVAAVVVNVTAVNPTEHSFVTVYPDGTARPNASNLNFNAGQIIPNLVSVQAGSDGKIDFYNNAGSVDLVADLSGYYYTPTSTSTSTGSWLDSMNPVRVLDTRHGTGGFSSPVGPGKTITLKVTGKDGVPSSGVTAVVVNVTAVNPTAHSFVTVYPTGTARPNASNLNFNAGQIIPNLVIVPVGTDGKISFYNNAGSVDLIADLSGYYYTPGGSGFDSLAPVRMLDTRHGIGGYSSPVGPGKTISLQVTGQHGVPPSGVTAVVLNVTAVNPTAHSFVTVYPDGTGRPNASNLNFNAGQVFPNLVVVRVGADGKVDFYNNAGSVDLIADLSGYFLTTPWGTATEVPHTAALNTGGGAAVISVSCPSAGNCTAGGVYADTSSKGQAFVADEVNGTWANATEVPGIAALNTGGRAEVTSVSCPSAGNCTAGGYYTDSSSHRQAFVADEANGTWGKATEIPGTATLNTGGHALVHSVSCASAGNCTAGGIYTESSGHYQAFVADEVSGTWNDATELPGTAALNTGGHAWVNSVSCGSAGNCAAGGVYGGSSGHYQAFVADEVSGTWNDATELPGTAALSTGGTAWLNSVSCTSAGNCAAGGYYSSGHPQAFVADEVNGTWNDATEVPGTAALDTGVYATVTSVSCTSAGNCAAGGSYDGYGGQQAFVASEVNGTWNDATELPGTAALNTGGFAVTSVSCASAGNCAVGGYYFDSFSNGQAFVASEVNGTWGNATEVPGTAALNTGGFAEVTSVSCTSAANCAAGGFYTESSGYGKAFVVSESP